MAKKLQLRRGTTAQHNSFTGDVGECTVDTTKDTLVVHDNSTQGGFPLAREDLNNVTSANIVSSINDDAITYAKMQDIATANRVLGRASAGEIQEVQIATDMIEADAVTYAKIQDSTEEWRVLGRASGTGPFSQVQVNTNHLVDDAVTYAKMQDVSATDRLLGRSTAGSGDVEEITCTAAGRALLDDADAAAQRTTLGVAGTAGANTFSATQSVTPDNASSDAAIDMSLSNFIEVGSTNPTSSPTNLVVGTSGIFYADTAAPTSWHSTFKHPGGAYTAPTSFPAMAPWYIAETNEILVGSWTQGIA